MVPEDMYVLSSDGFVLTTPVLKSYTHAAPKCTDCAPLFMKVTADFFFPLPFLNCNLL